MKIKKVNEIKGYEKLIGYEIREEGQLFTYWNNGAGNDRKSYLMKTCKEICIYLDSKGYVRNCIGGRNNYKIMEDIFEAFLGAVNLELDDNKTVEFIWKIIEKE